MIGSNGWAVDAAHSAHGGALLVANHAGAIPSDAPVIMHGIEKELGKKLYALKRPELRDGLIAEMKKYLGE